MTRLIIQSTLLILLFGLCSSNAFEASALAQSKDNIIKVAAKVTPEKTESDTFQKVNFLIDFSDYKEGSIDEWLEKKGFKFERGATDRKKLDFDVSENGLILEAKKRLRGYLVNEKVDLEEYSSVRIEWGIIKYPEGASYEKKVNNDALLVMIFFGYDKISSGCFAIPNCPYFIGLFLSKEDEVNKAYKGRYFRKGGRFVCVGNPEPGETVISEFDLITAFQKYFEKDEVPLISGIVIEVDTSNSAGGGVAAAYIKRIEFLE